MAAKLSVPATKVRNQTIAQDYLSGLTYREIGKKHNIAYTHVGHILRNDKTAKEAVEYGTQEMINAVPIATDNYLNKETGFLYSDNEKIRFDATNNLLKIARIVPTHTGANIYIDKLLMQQQNIINDPKVLKAIERYAQDDIIDVELPDFDETE
jgi:hypothetical protein